MLRYDDVVMHVPVEVAARGREAAARHNIDEDLGQEPEPFCAECSADIGIFLRYGTDWRHYLGDVSAGQIEVFDP